jgi:hypothetical protein
MLVMALGDGHGYDCTMAPQPIAGCDKQVKYLAKQFRDATTVLYIEPNAKIHGFYCYDLDIFFKLVTNIEGKRFALVYPPCIKERPHAPALGRQEFLQKLASEGVVPIKLSRIDAEHLVANSLVPAPGIIATPDVVTAELRGRLNAHGFTVIEPPDGMAPLGTVDEGYGVGLHCRTVEARPVSYVASSCTGGN